MANPLKVISNLFAGLKAAPPPTLKRSFSNPQKWLSLTDAFNNYQSGGQLNKAMRVSTFYACVDRKSNDMASLPLRPLIKTATGSTIAKDTDVYRLLNNPSPLFTKYTWQKGSNAHIDKDGDGALVHDAVGRGDKGKGRGDDPIPGLDTRRDDAQM